MKTLIEFLQAWYHTRKELEDMNAYVISELRRQDLMCFDLKLTPTRTLRIQHSLQPTKYHAEVWALLEQWFVLRKENDALQTKVKKLETRLADLNQNR